VAKSAKPSFGEALAVVRSNPDARFAALLAGVFAFSAGFVAGMVIGTREGREEAAVEPETA
jgi:hypothetical protein